MHYALPEELYNLPHAPKTLVMEGAQHKDKIEHKNILIPN